MEDERIKIIEQMKELNLAQILEQYETFERVYPYYMNMLQDHNSIESGEERVLKSTMKKQE
jgi:hypothetical protein